LVFSKKSFPEGFRLLLPAWILKKSQAALVVPLPSHQ
jgi:hypothetical protein